MPVKIGAAALLASRRLIEQSNQALDDAVALTDPRTQGAGTT